ncbi:hypothetical protein MTAT_19350 [Moorella thermoacetica]|uniref:Uncharacterized protein n=1 Tax=Neomoorella thermoacetica TaxID=1525 RepID=A0AAC9HIK5_NEOTH|nr:hypothetical protein Maut_02162 [Moorella thermoacetica]TYL12693.1 hypothetical protein MTAT_19350 [Moorella thermoacetica]
MSKKLMLTSEQSWDIRCEMCGRPLRRPNETLEEFCERIQNREKIYWGANVLSMAHFCSLRCASDWYSYYYE